ncbi:MAG: glycosyltransferase family 4 protein [Actinomycetota bacterium]|nr:glycosyltransferase family 4 protein [Actinomycetota bacterium]
MSSRKNIGTKNFHPAFVVPRYGEEVVGGAETLARLFAEELARRGLRVTALTTQALDHYTWKNTYPPGRAEQNGVEVIRFPAETKLGKPSLHKALAAISSGQEVSHREQIQWLSGVITSNELFRYIKKNKKTYSHLIFLPYLFGTTYFGSQIHPEISYIIPCLHDEPYAYQSLIRQMLSSVKGLMFNSPGEKRLASRLLEKEDPGPVVGMGFRPFKSDPYSFRNKYGIRGKFVLYAGRREEGKNTPLLLRYFREFVFQNPGAASLVLIGTGDVNIPYDCEPFIYDFGKIPEKYKLAAYAAANVFCQPSVNESLSIVLMEAWLAGTPVLVNRNCEVTREHVRMSGGGLTFGNYAEFAEALTTLLCDRELSHKLGEVGRQYVETEYNWDSVMDRLLEALGV